MMRVVKDEMLLEHFVFKDPNIYAFNILIANLSYSLSMKKPCKHFLSHYCPKHLILFCYLPNFLSFRYFKQRGWHLLEGMSGYKGDNAIGGNIHTPIDHTHLHVLSLQAQI